LTRAPPIERWITSVLAQNRTIRPALAGPSQNCRPAIDMLPDGGTTWSNSTGPPDHSVVAGSIVAAIDASGVGTVSKAGGSHSSTSCRCSSGIGVNRSAGVTGSLGSSAWCGRSWL